MTNNPADAMRDQIARVIFETRLYGDDEDVAASWIDLLKKISDNQYATDHAEWRAELVSARDFTYKTADAVLAALSAAKTDRDGAEDTARLDWLDQVNTQTNDRVGTSYGWKFDINHNRAALTDHNLPALHVRAAIDEARFKSAPVKQEGQMG